MKSRCLAMWSGPRNLSTAMMRSFAARDDCAVWDEPFYAAYLSLTGIDHPMREAVIGAGIQDWRAVAERCRNPAPGGERLFYQKQMTHHMIPEIGQGWIEAIDNAFLIRSPEAVAASYEAKREAATLADIGFVQQAELFDRVADHLGHAPPVIDAAAVRADPERTLRALCAALALEFQPAMLSWPAGLRDSDGVWAAHWYGAVLTSTGFAPPEAAPPDLSSSAQRLADAARPYYQRLAPYAL